MGSFASGPGNRALPLASCDHRVVQFEQELAQVLPDELPNRDLVIACAARHLALIVEANHHLNLTRITTPREAAIKHILDSVLPWRLFAGARHILDAGTGAGFPGIPLAMLFPGTRFTLAESIQKKARFVDSAVDALELPNVHVAAERAEALLHANRIDLITARAMAPISRTLPLFASAIKAGARVLLYKGPDVEAEISASAGEATKRRIRIRVVERYELPDALGTRTIVEMSR
jgi:16S rRNA (guanine527-N7)-methyltransferase